MPILLGLLALVVIGGTATTLAKRLNRPVRSGGHSRGSPTRSSRGSSSRSRTTSSSSTGGKATTSRRSGGYQRGNGGPSWVVKAWNASGAPRTDETTFKGAAAVVTGKAAGATVRRGRWAGRKIWRGYVWAARRIGEPVGNRTAEWTIARRNKRAARDTGMTCTKCGGPIAVGEKYVAINRHIEAMRGGAIDVEDAEALVIYHERCEPNQAFAGHEPVSATPINPDSKPEPVASPPPVHVNPFRSNKGEPVAIDIPTDFDRAAVPPTLAAHLNYIAELHPENDAEILNFLKTEVTGMLAYAEAVNTFFENCVTDQGLDPAAMQGVCDYAEAFSENATAAANGHKQFLAVYEAIIEAANNGVQMPYNGRFFSGEAAA